MSQNIFTIPSIEPQKHRMFRSWRELAYLALMAMEMSWIGLWFSNLSYTHKGVSFWKAYLILGIFLLGSNLVARAFNEMEIRLAIRRGAFLIALVVSIWIGLQLLLYSPEWLTPAAMVKRILNSFAELNTIPSEFWIMLAILLVYIRGVGLARRSLGIDLVLRNFQLGLLMFFLYSAAFQLVPLTTSLMALGLFFLFGLIAMSSGRIVESSRARGARITRVSFSWLVGIILAVLLIMVVTLLPAGLIPGDASAFVGRYLVLALALLGGLLALVTAPIILIVLYAIQFFQQIFKVAISWPGFSLKNLLPNFRMQQNLDNLVQQVSVVKPAVLWGILVMVLIIVLMGLSFRIWIERRQEAEEGESILDPADLLKNLREELRKRFEDTVNRLRGRPFGSARRLMAAARVRWMYARLMEECEALEHPRPPAVTPLEFLPDLRELFPEAEGECVALTEAYVRVRYGQLPEKPEEVEVLDGVWRRLEGAIKEKVK